MMSLIDLDDDQRWVPTHVNVTVLRARGLRTKGKHGSRYLYTIIQVGKEKYTTGLVEKAAVPQWNEECCFELLPGILEDGGRSAYPPGAGIWSSRRECVQEMSRYAALSGSVGQPFGEDGGPVVETREVEVQEEKRSKMKDFFKGKLRKSSDTRSCSSLASESMLTSQHTTKVLTHKRAFSDEASKITALPRPNLAMESLKAIDAKSSGALPSKLVLLEKCSPLSRSLQNLTKRSEDKGSFAEGRRWSFDKLKKEEKEEEKESQASSPPNRQAQSGSRPVQAAAPIVSSASDSPEKGRKLRKTLFSGGRSDSLPAKSDLNQATSASEGRLRGWFGSGDSQNKPRLEVSPKVESSSDVPHPLPPLSPVPYQCSSTSPSPSAHVSPDDCSQSNPFTPSSSPSSTPLSPSNPFLPRMQRNPFFEELIAEESQRSPPFAPCSSSGSSPFHYTTLPPQPYTPSPAHNAQLTQRESSSETAENQCAFISRI
ncbi:hypothetical protein INR49_013515 [Caranx melampygus]|nr:hypothetical protein INR49_013515 [Caranx melampygus]